MKTLQYKRKLSQALLAILILFLFGMSAVLTISIRNATADAASYKKLGTESNFCYTVTQNARYSGDWIEVYFTSPSSYYAYDITVTGKTSDGKTINIGEKSNYYTQPAFAPSLTAFSNRSTSSTKNAVLSNKKNTFRMRCELVKNKNHHFRMRVRTAGTYTIKIRPAYDKVTTYKQSNGLLQSKIWVNEFPDYSHQQAVMVAYLNRYDIRAFCEAIDSKKSADKTPGAVGKALYSTLNNAVGFIPYVGTASDVISYISDLLDAIEGKLYSEKTQDRTIAAVNKVANQPNYNKSWTTGVKIVIKRSRFGFNCDVSASAWNDKRSSASATVSAYLGLAGQFYNFCDWNV